jgi:hypothetical protein
MILFCCKQPNPMNQGVDKREFKIRLEELILMEDNPRKEFIVKEILKEKILEYKVVYIGAIPRSNNDVLQFVYTTTYTGLYEDSKRANSTITLYENNVRMGQYFIGAGFSETPYIEGIELVVPNNWNNCSATTRITFQDSIPQEIFIECKTENSQMFGDVYKLDSSR